MIPGILGSPGLELVAELPPGQKRCLFAIAELQANGLVKYTELVKMLGQKWRNTVHQQVMALRRKGYVTWEPTKAGTLQLVKPLMFREVPFRRMPIVEVKELDDNPTNPVYGEPPQ